MNCFHCGLSAASFLTHLVLFSSKEILSKRGFKVYVERVPHTSEAVGCGYGVYVPQRTDAAQQILERSGIRILGRMERADLR